MQPKCVILAGGKGTRLPKWPLNKHLALVYDRPQIDHVIGYVDKLGIAQKNTAILYSEPHGRQIVSYLAKEYTTINQHEPMGIAHGLYCTKSWVGESPVIVLLGDQFFGEIEPIKQAWDSFLASTEDARICLVHSNYAYKHNRVTITPQITFEEKPQDMESGYIAVGIYMFRSAAFSAIEHQLPDNRKEYNFSDTLQVMQKNKKKIGHFEYFGFWCDNGTPENILRSANYLENFGGAK